MNIRTPRTLPIRYAPTALRFLANASLAVLLAAAPAAWSQHAAPTLLASSSSTAFEALPDAPGSLRSAPVDATSSSIDFSGIAPAGANADGQANPTVTRIASHSDKYIAPGEAVPNLSVSDKIVLGVKDAISPLAFVGWVASAGYEQALNGSPNYGTNSQAFAQRFGAAAARATSEGIFSDSVLAPLLREDPRYYRMGPGHNVGKRLIYAVSRTFITRTDGGQRAPNSALIAGNLAGAYLTKAYYPDLNTSSREVLKTFGGSIGGSALGFAVSEFLSGPLNIFHLSRPTHN